MATPRLSAMGLTPAAVEELGLYPALIAMVDTEGLVAGHVTVGLVEELVGLVHSKANRWDKVPPTRLGVQEFCHVVAYIAARKEVTDKVRRSLWRPVVMKKQLEELGREELWPSLSFVPGFDITTVVMEGGVEEDVLEEEMGVQAEVQEELLEEEQEVVLVREEGRGGEAEAKMEEMRSEIVETEGADMIEEGELDACNLVSSLFLYFCFQPCGFYRVSYNTGHPKIWLSPRPFMKSGT